MPIPANENEIFPDRNPQQHSVEGILVLRYSGQQMDRRGGFGEERRNMPTALDNHFGNLLRGRPVNFKLPERGFQRNFPERER